MPYTVVCPECEGNMELADLMAGEIVPCAYCGVDLEVLSLDPLRVELAPQEAEDWGE
jgi:alpha-aminoadipate carrier protein LysW